MHKLFMRLNFFPWTIGAILGLLLSPWLPVLLTPTVWIILTVVLSSCACAVLVKKRFQYSPIIANLTGPYRKITANFVSPFCGGVLCAICWVLFNQSLQFSWQLSNEYWRQPAGITLYVMEISDHGDFRTQITGCIVQAPSAWEVPERHCAVRVRTSWYGDTREQPLGGEIWQFEARLKPSSGTLNPGVFDYQKYLARHRIRLVGSVSNGQRLSVPSRLSFHYWRNLTFSQLARHRGELQQEGLILALGLGLRHWLSPSDWDVLKRTGLSHVIAISGLHLGLVFLMGVVIAKVCFRIYFMLARLLFGQVSLKPLVHRNSVFVMGFLIAVAYAAVAGFPITTVRALVFIALFATSLFTHERKDVFRVWAYAVLLILWIDPWAWMATGFWLSVCAVLSIFAWHWRARHKVGRTWKSKVRALWRFECMLLIMLLPVSIMFFQGVAWLAPLTNLILVPLFTLILLPLTLLSVVFSWFQPSVSLFVWLMLDHAYQFVMAVLSKVSNWELSWLPVWNVAIGWWLFATVLVGYMPWRVNMKLMVAIILVVTGVLFTHLPKNPPFAIHVMDVGQGTAIILEQGEHAAVIDTGPAYQSGYSAAQSILLPFMYQRGLKLEWGVVSHRHSDHSGGQQSLAESFPDALWMNNQANERGCYFGQQWLWREVQVRVLSPLPGPRYGPNNDSCVISVTYRGQKILFPGDSGYINELRLYGRYGQQLKHDVLVVAHHGSQSSSQPEFLDVVQPDIAVVSRGFANQFGMPSDEVLSRYHSRAISLYDTGRHGAVSLFYQDGNSGEKWRVQLMRDDQNAPWFHQLPSESLVISPSDNVQ